MHAAGAEANVLAGLARLGARTASSAPARHTARSPGRGREWPPPASTSARALGRRRADRHVLRRVRRRAARDEVLYDRAGSAFARTPSADGALGGGTRYAVLSGITLAVSPTPTRPSRWPPKRTASGAALCVDVNYRARLWIPTMPARPPRAAARAEVVVCAGRDAETEFGADPATGGGSHPPRA